MKILVASPVHGQTGNTVCLAFLATAISLTQKKSVCITHADFKSNELRRMFGIEKSEDITKSLSQVVKLLKSNSITPSDVVNYATQIMSGLDLYTTTELTLEQSEVFNFYEFLLNKMTIYSHIFIDMDAGYTNPISNLCQKIADTIIITVNQNDYVLERAKVLKNDIIEQHELNRKHGETDKNILFLLNNYDPIISSYKKVASKLNISSNKLIVLHHNAYIAKYINLGKIDAPFIKALENNMSVIQLRNDMKQACKIILGKEFVWKGK